MKETKLTTSEIIDKYIGQYPDFPKKGIYYYDLNGILNSKYFPTVIAEFVHQLRDDVIYDGIVGIDAKGFVLGAPIAAYTEKNLILARKKGKLPGDLVSVDYALEYGTGTLEIQKKSLEGHKNVVIIDDLIATGGSMAAVRDCLNKQNVKVAMYMACIGLKDLNYRKKLNDAPVYVIREY